VTQADLLHRLIAAELDEAVPPSVEQFAAQLAARHPGTVAVLYYGSNLRTGDLTASLLDYYLIVERYGMALGSGAAAIANWLLPPNVYYAEWQSAAGDTLRCKYAILSMADLQARTMAKTLDVSIWARFAQPIRCVWATDPAARQACLIATAQAVRTAFGSVPHQADPLSHWASVFARTYRCELRAERAGKGAELTLQHAQRYEQLSALLSNQNPSPLEGEGGKGSTWWLVRRWFGRAQHLARLIKASFTFAGGVDYLAWKITRHSGQPVTVSDWQRRHPVIGGAVLLVGLLRRGAIR
jgi:hypothetical protein